MDATALAKLGDIEAAGFVERADDAPLLVGQAARMQMRAKARHHRLARTHQLHRQRALERAHAHRARRHSTRAAIVRLTHDSATTSLRRIPISGTSTSTASPGTSQRGGSKRAPAPVGVPVTIRSPGFSAVKMVM